MKRCVYQRKKARCKEKKQVCVYAERVEIGTIKKIIIRLR